MLKSSLNWSPGDKWGDRYEAEHQVAEMLWQRFSTLNSCKLQLLSAHPKLCFGNIHMHVCTYFPLLHTCTQTHTNVRSLNTALPARKSVCRLKICNGAETSPTWLKRALIGFRSHILLQTLSPHIIPSIASPNQPDSVKTLEDVVIKMHDWMLVVWIFLSLSRFYYEFISTQNSYSLSLVFNQIQYIFCKYS